MGQSAALWHWGAVTIEQSQGQPSNAMGMGAFKKEWQIWPSLGLKLSAANVHKA